MRRHARPSGSGLRPARVQAPDIHVFTLARGAGMAGQARPGALAIAGLFTFVPGRIMYRVVFGS